MINIGGLPPVEAFMNRRWAASRWIDGITSSISIGMLLNAAGSTTADLTDDVSNWAQMRAANTIISRGYVRDHTKIQVRRTHEFDFRMRIKTVSITGMRLWIGLVDADMTADTSDPASRHLAMFRFADDISPNWFACTKDGTTLNAVDTGTPFLANTIYEPRIWASPGGGKINFQLYPQTMQDAWVTKELVDNLPGPTTLIGFEAVIFSHVTAVHDVGIGSMAIEWNG